MVNEKTGCQQGHETLVTSVASGLAALLLEETVKQGKQVEIEGTGIILGKSNLRPASLNKSALWALPEERVGYGAHG